MNWTSKNAEYVINMGSKGIEKLEMIDHRECRKSNNFWGILYQDWDLGHLEKIDKHTWGKLTPRIYREWADPSPQFATGEFLAIISFSRVHHTQRRAFMDHLHSRYNVLFTPQNEQKMEGNDLMLSTKQGGHDAKIRLRPHMEKY